MSLDEARASSILRVVAWPFFRHPGAGFRRYVTAGVLALVATIIGTLHTHLFRLPAEPLTPDNHAHLSLGQALAWHFCGTYGALGARFAHRPLLDLANADKPFSTIIVESHGSVAQFCEGLQHGFLQNENSLFLLEATLLALPPDDSLATLAVKLTAFRCVLLFLSLSVLAYTGASLLPLLLVSLVACRLFGVTSTTHLFSIYPTMTVLLFFSSASIAVLSRFVDAARIGWLTVVALGFGLILGFTFNWRTSYGAVVLAQLVFALAVMRLFRWGAPRGMTPYGAAAVGVTAGFLLFQSVFIWPLQSRSSADYNTSHHPFWHPIVLGLANPSHPLAEREGIQWNDAIGLTLAKLIDPNVTELGSSHDAALASYYFGLWKKHPKEMLDLYRSKVFETTRSMMTALGPLFEWPGLTSIAARIVPNGYAWVGGLLFLGALAVLGASPFPTLLAISAALFGALILVTIEQVIVHPIFSVLYQGGLIVNLAALLAILATLAFAWLLRVADRRPVRSGRGT